MAQTTRIPRPVARAWRGTLSVLTAAALATTLAACDDDANVSTKDGAGGGAGTASTATTNLGPVGKAAVVAFAANELDRGRSLSEQMDAVLAQAATNAAGVAAGLDLGDHDGPVLYALVVDSNSRYYDEAAGGDLMFSDSTFFPDGTLITAITTARSLPPARSPATSMAASLPPATRLSRAISRANSWS